MKRVGVIFGGVTCEHEVSIVTGLQLIGNIDRTKYEVVPIYIHSDGEWYVGDKLLDGTIYKDFDSYKGRMDKGFIPPNRPGILMQNKGFMGRWKIRAYTDFREYVKIAFV